MEMIEVSSFAIRAIGYTATSSFLKITFSEGHTYDFFGVPEHVFNGLLGAPSKGRYYNDHIRGFYEC